MKKYLKIIIAPVVIISFLFLLDFIFKLFNLPSGKDLIPIIKVNFELYGIWLVFISAILESAFVIGVYAPGSLVIFLGVIFSIGNPVQASMVVLSVAVGFLIGFSIDFFLGKYGWYKFLLHFGFEKMILKTKEKIEKYGISTAWIAYHHPDFGSFVATTYGILQYSYRKFIFITLPPVVVWCTFWGIISYTLGDQVLKLIGYKILLIIFVVWVIVRIIETKISERSNL